MVVCVDHFRQIAAAAIGSVAVAVGGRAVRGVVAGGEGRGEEAGCWRVRVVVVAAWVVAGCCGDVGAGQVAFAVVAPAEGETERAEAEHCAEDDD